LTENLLSLLGADGELAETVQRSIVTQKIFENAREEKDASADKLFFVEFHFDAVSADGDYLGGAIAPGATRATMVPIARDCPAAALGAVPRKSPGPSSLRADWVQTGADSAIAHPHRV